MRKPREWPGPVPGGGLLSVVGTLRPHAPHLSCSLCPLTHQRPSLQRAGELGGAAGADKHHEGATMPARACRHGPAFWGHALAVGLSGAWVSAQPLASGAGIYQRRPALGRDHQPLWSHRGSLELGGSEGWGPLGEDPIWQGPSPEKAGHGPHPTSCGGGWWQRDRPTGPCVFCTLREDPGTETQRRQGWRRDAGPKKR